MPPDEQIRTAHAVVLQPVKSKPTTILHSRPAPRRDRRASSMGPTKRPCPRPPNAAFHHTSSSRRRSSSTGGTKRSNYTCPQNGSSVEAGGSLRLHECENPSYVNNYPQLRAGRPLTPPPSSQAAIQLSAWCDQPPPSPLTLPSPIPSPSLPYHAQKSYRLWPHSFQQPTFAEGVFRRILRRAKRNAPRPPSPYPPEELEYQRRLQAQQAGIRAPSESIESDLHQRFVRDALATTPARADYLREQRGLHELQTINGQQEQSNRKESMQIGISKQEKTEEYVPEWVREMLRIKQERPGPDALFKRDFNFGPRRGGDDDYLEPLSPHSSCTSLADPVVEFRGRSIKRQRHDSSTVDAVRGFHRELSNSGSSFVLDDNLRPDGSTAEDTMEKCSTTDAHPGHLVDFSTPDSKSSKGRRSHTHSSISALSLGDSASYLDMGSSSLGDECTKHQACVHSSSYSSVSSCCLETHTAQQSKHMNAISAAQKAVDDGIRATTCGIQRVPRTTRDQSPYHTVSSNTSLIQSRTAESSESQRLSRKDRLRQRSYVARSESADAFLRFVRQGPEARRRAQRGRAMERSESANVLEKRLEIGGWNTGVPL